MARLQHRDFKVPRSAFEGANQIGTIPSRGSGVQERQLGSALVFWRDRYSCGGPRGSRPLSVHLVAIPLNISTCDFINTSSLSPNESHDDLYVCCPANQAIAGPP